MHDHENTYLFLMNSTTAYLRAMFLPIVGTLPWRYSLQEVAPKVEINFLNQGREHKLYLTTTYTVDLYAKSASTGFTGNRVLHQHITSLTRNLGRQG